MTARDVVEPLDGFRVITPSGKLLGEVAGVSSTAIVVQMRRLGRSIYRPLPRDCALVWAENRTVVAQLSARQLRAAPPLRPDAPFDEDAPAAFRESRSADGRPLYRGASGVLDEPQRRGVQTRADEEA